MTSPDEEPIFDAGTVKCFEDHVVVKLLFRKPTSYQYSDFDHCDLDFPVFGMKQSPKEIVRIFFKTDVEGKIEGEESKPSILIGKNPTNKKLNTDLCTWLGEKIIDANKKGDSATEI